MKTIKKNVMFISILFIILTTFTLIVYGMETNTDIKNGGGSIKDRITSDDLRIKSLSLETIDGTENWDTDDQAGNDSGPSNGIVRSFDRLTYNLRFTTESKDNNVYKTGRIYFEIELPVGKDKAEFDTAAMGMMDVSPEYMWKVEETNGKQILKCYYHMNTKVNGSGDEEYPLPSIATFPVYIQVKGMKNGELLIPKFKTSVVYEEDGEIKTEGNYNKPQSTTSNEIRVSATARYNIELKKTTDTYAGNTAIFDFDSGDDTALNKGSGKVYGKIQAYAVNLQLRNGAKENGLKGVEFPSGKISGKIKVASNYIGDSGTDYGKVENPIVWGYGPHKVRKNLNGRDLEENTLGYLAHVAPKDRQEVGEFKTLEKGQASDEVWNGGKWEISQNDDEINLNIEDYIINPDWFPSGTLGNQNSLKDYYDYELGGVQNIGAFSAGSIYVIVPFGGENGVTDDSYYSNKFGETGKVKTEVEIVEFNASSETGKNVGIENQDRDDDKVESVVSLFSNGYYNKYVNFRKHDFYGVDRGMDGILYGEDHKNGTDSQSIGGKVGVTLYVYSDPLGHKENSIHGLNSLLKFDDKYLALEKDEPIKTMHFPEYSKALFAAKVDGKGWENDQEMNDLNEEDLIYYESLDNLEEDGKICVGILNEVRIPYEIDITKPQMLAIFPNFKIKEDVELIGKTTMITSVDNVWRKEDYKLAIDENAEILPSRLQLATGDTLKHMTFKNDKRFYKKAYYDENGYSPETGGEPAWGDTLYIIPYKSIVDKKVSQKDNAGKEKYYFNLAENQSIVDYAIYPKLEVPSILADLLGTDFRTKIVIKDILPKGLEYLDGSSVQGGSYNLNSNPNMSGQIIGGKKLEPNIITNQEGNQELTWTIDEHTITENIKPIHYKVSIDPFSYEGQQYTNNVTIETTEDKRVIKPENGNKHSSKIEISSPSILISEKKSSKAIYEKDELIEYNIRWMNRSEDYRDNSVMMDTMPQNGDQRGSSYKGNYTVDYITFNLPTAINENYRFYYTSSKEVVDKIAKDYEYESFINDEVVIGNVIWKKASISDDGKVENIKGKEVTGWILLGELGKGSEIKSTVGIKPDGNQNNDMYMNSASIYDLEKIAKASIIGEKKYIKTTKIVMDENANVLDGSKFAEKNDILTYRVEVEAFEDMFIKIEDDILPELEYIDNSAVLSNGKTVKFENKKLTTDIFKLDKGKTVVLEFDARIIIDQGFVNNMAIVWPSVPDLTNPEKPGEDKEPLKPKAPEIPVEKSIDKDTQVVIKKIDSETGKRLKGVKFNLYKLSDKNSQKNELDILIEERQSLMDELMRLKAEKDKVLDKEDESEKNKVLDKEDESEKDKVLDKEDESEKDKVLDKEDESEKDKVLDKEGELEKDKVLDKEDKLEKDNISTKDKLISVDISIEEIEGKIKAITNRIDSLAANLDKNMELIGTYVTDLSGLVQIKNLENGKYIIKEIEAADGYVLPGDKEYQFEIKDIKELLKFEIKNERKKIEEKVHIYYDGNGNTDGVDPIDLNNPYSKGDMAKILGKETLVRKNHTFLGWSLDKNASRAEYNKDDKIILQRDTTLYAVWSKDSDGGRRRPKDPKPKEPEIDKLVELDTKNHYAYLIGYPDGSVQPEGNITRAEVATIFFRMMTDSSRNSNWSSENIYKDVKNHKWYNNALSTLSNANVLKGYPDGNFKPNSNITRGEFAEMVSKFLSEHGDLTNNKFKDIKGNWAEKSIEKLYSNGLINGFPDGSFKPNQVLTRGEAATLINAILERSPDEENLLKDMKSWKDNNKDSWYYSHIQEATNSHNYIKESDEDSELWTEILPIRDWVKFEKEWSNANSATNPGDIDK